jgi:hypothetical protein
LVRTDVSEERIASIFRVGRKNKRNSRAKWPYEAVKTDWYGIITQLVRTVTSLANFSCFSPYPEDGGDTFLRNVGSNQ